MPERLWKVTGPNGESIHGGAFTYDLPKLVRGRWVPGAWTPPVAVIPCVSGYHGCRDEDLLYWCRGARIWAMESRGETVVHKDGVPCESKVVCASVRLVAPTPWDATTARLFAVECAAEVAHRMPDARSLDALEVAYRHAVGDATDAELVAAGAAARAAARAAAWGVAAGDAAGVAAWVAAWDAARDAAGDVARDAAGVAAWDAAGDVARDAAGVAAWAAARAAAHRRNTHRLLWWIGASDTYLEATDA